MRRRSDDEIAPTSVEPSVTRRRLSLRRSIRPAHQGGTHLAGRPRTHAPARVSARCVGCVDRHGGRACRVAKRRGRRDRDSARRHGHADLLRANLGEARGVLDVPLAARAAAGRTQCARARDLRARLRRGYQSRRAARDGPGGRRTRAWKSRSVRERTPTTAPSASSTGAPVMSLVTSTRAASVSAMAGLSVTRSFTGVMTSDTGVSAPGQSLLGRRKSQPPGGPSRIIGAASRRGLGREPAIGGPISAARAKHAVPASSMRD